VQIVVERRYFMLAQDSDNQQQQNFTSSKSNHLFKENNSSNKGTAIVSFTNKLINDIHIEVLKRKINSINHTYQNYFMKFLSRIQKMQNYYVSI
jgi:hypothetical protein